MYVNFVSIFYANYLKCSQIVVLTLVGENFSHLSSKDHNSFSFYCLDILMS